MASMETKDAMKRKEKNVIMKKKTGKKQPWYSRQLRSVSDVYNKKEGNTKFCNPQNLISYILV